MAKKITGDKISKLAQQRESVKQQLETSKQKITQYENKLATEIGYLALANNLDKLGEDKLKTIFEKIAKENNLI